MTDTLHMRRWERHGLTISIGGSTWAQHGRNSTSSYLITSPVRGYPVPTPLLLPPSYTRTLSLSWLSLCFPRYHAPPERLPGSILSLSSTGTGGRGSTSDGNVIGDVINHGKAKYWVRGGNYHCKAPSRQVLVLVLLIGEAGLVSRGLRSTVLSRIPSA